MTSGKRRKPRGEFEAMLEQGWILISPGFDVFYYDDALAGNRSRVLSKGALPISGRENRRNASGVAYQGRPASASPINPNCKCGCDCGSDTLVEAAP